MFKLTSLVKKFKPFEKNKSRFSFNQNHFTFEYNGIWFQSSENLTYRYKLQNYDFDWSKPSHFRSVTYSSLPPGNYTFNVEVSFKPGIWVSSKESEYTFDIRPPFYKTWWFILLSIITIVLFVLNYIRSRTAKLVKAKEELELK